MPTTDFKKKLQLRAKNEQFDVGADDFAALTVGEADPNSGFHFFYHSVDRRLVKNFVLRDGPQVSTMCEVTLIKKADDGWSPRLRFWKMDKTKAKAGQQDPDSVEAERFTVLIKAQVDLDDCYENFWRLVRFLESFKGLTIPADELRLARPEDLELIKQLEGRDKQEILSAVEQYLGGQLTEVDLRMLVDRKGTLERFEKMLEEPNFFAAEKLRMGKDKGEAVWQQFFEDHTWIFGYGLILISCDPAGIKKLEQITTGASFFDGGGKRTDALMRTRGFVQSLLFAEIKLHDADLLAKALYRKPDTYRVDSELSGAVAQVQKTAHKAVRERETLDSVHTPEGDYRYDLATVKPRQVVIMGNLREFADDQGNVNIEKLSSFELYRRSQTDTEIITFDELLERARFIVQYQP